MSGASKIKNFLLLSCAMLLAASTFAAGPHLPRAFPKRIGGPAVQFSSTAVMATGVTPGAFTAIAGVSIGTDDLMRTIAAHAAMIAADTQGDVSYDVPGGISTRAVWIIVDASGGYTVTAPPGMLLREMSFPGRGIGASGNGVLRRILLDRFSLDAFLIRPGMGVWTAHLQDGASSDDDVATGRIAADLAAFTPTVETTEPLERVEPGDLLFVVDPQSLEFAVVKHAK